jgi:hypothetical protein
MKSKLWVAALCLLLTPVYLLSMPPPLTRTQTEIINRLASKDWKVRDEAVREARSFKPEELEPALRDALIELLESETQRVWDRFTGKVAPETFPEIGGEGFAEYYSALVGTVLNLHEENALPALVAAASSHGTQYIAQLGAFGRPALKPVFARLLDAPNELVKGAMADILAQMLIQNREHKLKAPLTEEDLADIRESLQPVLSSSNNHTQLDAAFALALIPDYQQADAIKGVFQACLDDPSPGGRLSMLRRLDRLADAKFVPFGKVKEMADRDDFKVDLTNPYARKQYNTEYPIRQLAREVLEKFSKSD